MRSPVASGVTSLKPTWRRNPRLCYLKVTAFSSLILDYLGRVVTEYEVHAYSCALKAVDVPLISQSL
jgi:hypothetical protein